MNTDATTPYKHAPKRTLLDRLSAVEKEIKDEPPRKRARSSSTGESAARRNPVRVDLTASFDNAAMDDAAMDDARDAMDALVDQMASSSIANDRAHRKAAARRERLNSTAFPGLSQSSSTSENVRALGRARDDLAATIMKAIDELTLMRFMIDRVDPVSARGEIVGLSARNALHLFRSMRHRCIDASRNTRRAARTFTEAYAHRYYLADSESDEYASDAHDE